MFDASMLIKRNSVVLGLVIQLSSDATVGILSAFILANIACDFWAAY